MNVTINGTIREIDEGQADRPLIGFLREDLDLTGVKNGCGVGVCGSCTVLLDMKPVKACNLTVRDVAGGTVLTIEGMTPPGRALHPLQQAFIDHGAIQCGYCTPGMVLTAHALLAGNPAPTRAEIRLAINPNLCRCTGYQQIVDAIEAAAPHYR